MIGGRGAYVETLSVSLQLLSVIYVISCLLALGVGAIVQLEIVQDLARRVGDPLELLVRKPVGIYFVTQTVLMLIYLAFGAAPRPRFRMVPPDSSWSLGTTGNGFQPRSFPRYWRHGPGVIDRLSVRAASPNHTLQRTGKQLWCAAWWSSQQSGVGQPPPLSVSFGC
jgi:hypothetical protein